MNSTGITIFAIDTLEPICVTHVKVNPKDTHGERLHEQREYIKKLIATYPPYEIAIERGYTFYNNATQVLYRAHGNLNELFYQYPQTYYPPKTVKKVVGKSGNATKEKVQEEIQKRFPNVEFANDDESDSFAVAITMLVNKYDMKW